MNVISCPIHTQNIRHDDMTLCKMVITDPDVCKEKKRKNKKLVKKQILNVSYNINSLLLYYYHICIIIHIYNYIQHNYTPKKC